jgi:hypothetical protein
LLLNFFKKSPVGVSTLLFPKKECQYFLLKSTLFISGNFPLLGVPKLQRSELEGACEDFSNIVASYPQYTVYKGTLSSGVEIAVVSTMIISSKDWSKHSEGRFRKKVMQYIFI